MIVPEIDGHFLAIKGPLFLEQKWSSIPGAIILMTVYFRTPFKLFQDQINDFDINKEGIQIKTFEKHLNAKTKTHLAEVVEV